MLYFYAISGLFHVQFAIFFKFMAAKVSIACMDNFLSPLKVVHRIPCFSFASAKTRSIVSLRFSYMFLLSLVYDEDDPLLPHNVPKYGVESIFYDLYFGYILKVNGHF